jgi:hypothetical protein
MLSDDIGDASLQRFHWQKNQKIESHNRKLKDSQELAK